MLFFTIYFDRSSREDSFIILFVITLQITLVNILEIIYFKLPPVLIFGDKFVLHRCQFKFESPSSPTFEYSSLLAYCAIDFMLSKRIQNKFCWAILFFVLNLGVSFFIGLISMNLGIATLGSIVFAWTLGSSFSPLLQLAKQPLKQMAT